MAKAAHWADQVAQRIIHQKGDKELYTLASGITPSGTVHIGNFRELITVDLVANALRKMGKKVRFIFSWDDYDVFRKVPQNMPNQEELKKFLGKPIVKTPDPFGEEESYARHHEVAMEKSIARVGIEPEFLYQAKKYRGGEYAEGMKTAMQKRDVIASILNEHRKTPLEENWYPVSIFSSFTDSNDTEITDYDGEYAVTYRCNESDKSETIDLRETSCAKLLWRIDWPMRWAHEAVDFEPGGKDHSSEGGSYTTAQRIAKEVYNFDPPIYMMYDFIRIKGKGGKISSSSGEVITLDDVLEVYSPQLIRWIFSSYRNNVEFAISFDLDVLKIYEDFDRMERKYFGIEELGAKQADKVKRIYELSQVEGREVKQASFQAAFRHLCNILQINDFNEEKVLSHYEADLKTEADRNRLIERMHCAKKWIQEDSPEDFRFQIQTVETVEKIPPALHAAFEKTLYLLNDDKNYTEVELNDALYAIIHELEIDNKDFFTAFYKLVIKREKGPKLASFILSIGKSRVAELIQAGL